MCDECTWHHKTFLVQWVYWHLAIKLYCNCIVLYCMCALFSPEILQAGTVKGLSELGLCVGSGGGSGQKSWQKQRLQSALSGLRSLRGSGGGENRWDSRQHKSNRKKRRGKPGQQIWFELLGEKKGRVWSQSTTGVRDLVVKDFNQCLKIWFKSVGKGKTSVCKLVRLKAMQGLAMSFKFRLFPSKPWPLCSTVLSGGMHDDPSLIQRSNVCSLSR